jgi:tripartite-type tricarboxylate transporter receptor subunit TctC
VKCFAVLSVFFAAAVPAVWAQPYPAKPMTLIVPFPPGAATDVFVRAAGKRMGELLRQQIVVLNRDGASGLIGTEQWGWVTLG